MADYPLNCTWEDVEHTALNPNVFVKMLEYHDIDIGDINVADKSGSEIYDLLQHNPNIQIVFVDLNGRQCLMTAAPSTLFGEIKFSVLVGNTVYVYRIPDGGRRVFTDTMDISGGDVFLVRITRRTVSGSYEYTADQSYSDIRSAILADKVVFAKTTYGIAWCSGEINDDEITFVVSALSAVTPGFYIFKIDDTDSVSLTIYNGGTGGITPESVVEATADMNAVQKSSTLANLGGYAKPGNGIPSTDLASDIQTALAEAGTALQPNASATILQMSISGTAVTLNYSAAYVIELCSRQEKVYIMGGGLVFVPTFVDSLNNLVALTTMYEGVIYSVVLTPLTSSSMAGTLVGTPVQSFHVTISYSNGSYSADQTLSDILDAIENGWDISVSLPDADRGWLYWHTVNSVLFMGIDDALGGSVMCLHVFTMDANGITVEDFNIISHDPVEQTVSGTTPSIAAAVNTIYKCGEVTSLTLSSIPATGMFTVIFTSGSTAATFTKPNSLIMPNDFQVEANTRYEINVSDGYGVVASWAVTSS